MCPAQINCAPYMCNAFYRQFMTYEGKKTTNSLNVSERYSAEFKQTIEMNEHSLLRGVDYAGNAGDGSPSLFIKSKFVPCTFSLDSCVLDM